MPSLSEPAPIRQVPDFEVHRDRDQRKSARLAASRTAAEPGARIVSRLSMARDILRNPSMEQAGVEDVPFDRSRPDHAPVFYLDGDPHRRKRTAIARFFTPKAVATRHRPVMERMSDLLLDRLRRAGQARLDVLSFELAARVAAEIVGLADSEQAGLARRVQATLTARQPFRWAWLSRKLGPALAACHGVHFFLRDVRPAIRARRRARRDDVISHLLDEGYSDRAILIECMTYGVAGMVTTREFIVMAAWHLFEEDALRALFLDGGEAEQIAILEEILRLEPVAAMLHRRTRTAMPLAGEGPAAAGTVFSIDVRAVNADEEAVGACPFAIDPGRGRQGRAGGSALSFGDGAHRCPGAQVALQETRVFLDRLLRVPGIRLARPPDMGWSDLLMSYELRNAVVACERQG